MRALILIVLALSLVAEETSTEVKRAETIIRINALREQAKQANQRADEMEASLKQLDVLGNPVPDQKPTDPKTAADDLVREAKKEAKIAVRLAKEFQAKAKKAGQDFPLERVIDGSVAYTNKRSKGDEFETKTTNAEVRDSVEKIGALRFKAVEMLKLAGINAVAEVTSSPWILENGK